MGEKIKLKSLNRESSRDYNKDRETLNNILLNNSSIKNKALNILNIIPELQVCVECEQDNPAHIYNVYEHIEETVSLTANNLILRLSALLHDIGKPYKKYRDGEIDRFTGHWTYSAILADLILRRLGYDTVIINSVCTLVKYHDYLTIPTEQGVLDTIDLVGDNLMPYLLLLKHADILAHSSKYAKIREDSLIKIVDIYKQYFNPMFKL